MRIVIATDSIGPFSSAAAGASLAEGWPSAETTVVAMGESGTAFVAAVGDLTGGELRLAADRGLISSTVDTAAALVISTERAGADPAPSSASSSGPTSGPASEPAAIDLDATSTDLGSVLRDALNRTEHTDGEIVLDLTGGRAHDGGAGLLAELGAVADVDLRAGVNGLAGLTRLDLEPARRLLAGRALVGVIGADQADWPLLGLRGITSRLGRETGMDPEAMLRTDAVLERFAQLVEHGGTAPATEAAGRPTGVSGREGAGAAGGLGFAVLALGGRLTTGPAYCARLGRLPERLRGADLAVTGCTVYDFARRGGGVLAEVAAQAVAALVPCVVAAGEVLVGAREMRTMGVEAAYAVREPVLGRGPDHQEDWRPTDLTALATRIGRSWSW